MVTARVADSGLSGTVREAKPLVARRRRRKFWALNAFLLNFGVFLVGIAMADDAKYHGDLIPYLTRPTVDLAPPVPAD